MTCDETRKILESRPAETCTRGERAAVYGHLMKCQACIGFMQNLDKQLTPAEREVSIAIHRRLHPIDIQDPEFVRTVYGD